MILAYLSTCVLITVNFIILNFILMPKQNFNYPNKKVKEGRKDKNVSGK